MGNFLLQKGLLIYILAPESCDSYMIFYNNYKFCLFVFVCLYQQITCLWHLRLMVTEQPGIYWPWPFRPYNIKGPLPWINKSKNSFIVSSWICWMWWDDDQRGDVKKGNCCGMRRWLMGGARVPGIACWWCDIGNCLGDHVIAVLGGFNDSAFGYLRQGVSGPLLPYNLNWAALYGSGVHH